MRRRARMSRVAWRSLALALGAPTTPPALDVRTVSEWDQARDALTRINNKDAA